MEGMMLYEVDTINQIKDIFIERKQTIAVAESVTAGHLQAALSSALQASEFFQGGITAYNLGQKTRHLQVDPIKADSSDCVDALVARTMAMNVATLFTADYGLAITGYASKMPEKGLTDLFAWVAISCEGKIILTEKLTTEFERVEAQVDYTKQVMRRLVGSLIVG